MWAEFLATDRCVVRQLADTGPGQGLPRHTLDRSGADGSSALLAIAPGRWWSGGTHGDQVVVPDLPDVVSAKCDESLRSTWGGHELDFDRIRPVDVNDRTQIAAPETVRRQVAVEHDDVKRMNSHFEPPGRREPTQATSQEIPWN
jgi:hypothetical protein